MHHPFFLCVLCLLGFHLATRCGLEIFDGYKMSEMLGVVEAMVEVGCPSNLAGDQRSHIVAGSELKDTLFLAICYYTGPQCHIFLYSVEPPNKGRFGGHPLYRGVLY